MATRPALPVRLAPSWAAGAHRRPLQPGAIKRICVASRGGLPAALHRVPHSTCLGAQLRGGRAQLLAAPASFASGRGRRRKERRLASAVSAELNAVTDLGLDSLTFLAAVVVVVPLFKSMKVSPVLGFLLGGVVLGQLHLFREEENVSRLAELGVLFLLFEQGLELSVDRLRALAKYAFGLGVVQVLASTAFLSALELDLFPTPNGYTSLGSLVLTTLFHADPSLVSIRSVDEALVIGAALSLSSSAFVLQLLSERGELGTQFGQATLGILLLQDVAVVPLLVILPLYEQGAAGGAAGGSMLAALAPIALKAAVGLGLIVLGGRVVLRKVFDAVASSRSTEAFVALCLLTVTGTGLLTQKLGFSDTLGAFLAGVLLSETNYRAQVEADIRPFRGLLLGLFFVTTGTSVDLQLLSQEWENVLALVGGLIAVKALIVGATGSFFGLTRAEAVRTGLLVSQGGEFAFVLLALANKLDVLPADLNKLLIIVVVISMALTPALAEAGEKAYDWVDSWERKTGAADGRPKVAVAELEEGGNEVVIVGFGAQGQTLANMLRAAAAIKASPSFAPAAAAPEGAAGGADGAQPESLVRADYVAFDMDPVRVKAGKKRGFNVKYGDASRAEVMRAAGVTKPRAVVISTSDADRALQSVSNLRAAFGTSVPIFARAKNPPHAEALRAMGATGVVLDSGIEAGLLLGAVVLQEIGVPAQATVNIADQLRTAIQTAQEFAPAMLEAKSVDSEKEIGAAFAAAYEEDAAATEASANGQGAGERLAEAGARAQGGNSANGDGALVAGGARRGEGGGGGSSGGSPPPAL